VLLVAVTGYGDEQARQQASAAGFDHHVVKPFDTAQLMALLDQASKARQGRESCGRVDGAGVGCLQSPHRSTS